MERNDLLRVNGGIFVGQGKAINDNASDNARIVVVGNPCNTNCLIAMHNAPRISRERWFAMTALDENRAKSQLATKAGTAVRNVSNMTIWGNHSATQYPDFYNAKINGKATLEVINDENSIREIEKPLLDKILDFDPILEVNKEENNELDPNAEKERIDQLKEEGKLIDAKQEKIIIDELRSDIKDIENKIEESENNNFDETTSQSTLLEDDENRENDYKKKIDEEKSFIDKIFDFDLFSSDDEELEPINQRERTFFERKKVESDDDKERTISDKNEKRNSSKDKVIDAVISEKEGSID